jgi:hypothetical protein
VLLQIPLPHQVAQVALDRVAVCVKEDYRFGNGNATTLPDDCQPFSCHNYPYLIRAIRSAVTPLRIISVNN